MTSNGQLLFISHASTDAQIARALSERLERLGITCWLAPRDVPPGSSYGNAIHSAIVSSKAVVIILSSKSSSSFQVRSELELAHEHGIPILAYKVDDVKLSPDLMFYLGHLHWFDGTASELDHNVLQFVEILRRIVPRSIPEHPLVADVTTRRKDQSKGYVFISYVRSDAAFVQELRKVFESKKYGYWDYAVGDRDYHGRLYRELEERIDGAVAFMTIVSDEWRNSDWVASEFIYAREATIPVFVIQARKLSRPFPILLNLQVRIDMSEDFDRGARTLTSELSKKGL